VNFLSIREREKKRREGQVGESNMAVEAETIIYSATSYGMLAG
jgi:hypothetical protein